MDYITIYYKELCEQLQGRINLLEARIRSASEIEELGAQEYKKALERKRLELGRDLTMDEVSSIAGETISPYAARAIKRENLVRKAMTQLRDVAISGDVETATQASDVMADMAQRSISGKVAAHRNLDPASAEMIQKGEQQISTIGKRLRGSGVPTNVPADIAAMRKFIAMGKGKYQAPFPLPPGEHHTSGSYQY